VIYATLNVTNTKHALVILHVIQTNVINVMFPVMGIVDVMYVIILDMHVSVLTSVMVKVAVPTLVIVIILHMGVQYATTNVILTPLVVVIVNVT